MRKKTVSSRYLLCKGISFEAEASAELGLASATTKTAATTQTIDTTNDVPITGDQMYSVKFRFGRLWFLQGMHSRKNHYVDKIRIYGLTESGGALVSLHVCIF